MAEPAQADVFSFSTKRRVASRTTEFKQQGHEARFGQRPGAGHQGSTVNAAYISALAALAGSAIGALASFATTWLTQSVQDRNQRQAQSAGRRERLYGEFIDEASLLFADALTHDLQDSAKLVHLYALMSKIRLFAPDSVTEASGEVLQNIIEAYGVPNLDVTGIKQLERSKVDVLRSFTEKCRKDLLG